MVPFLTLLLPRFEGFVPIPRVLTHTFRIPRSDVGEYGRSLLIPGNNLQVPLPRAASIGPSFLQLDVWVGRDSRECQAGICPLAWVYKPELVRNAPDPQTVEASKIDYDFVRDYRVTLAVSRPRGELESPRVLRPRLAHDINSTASGGLI